MKSAILSLLFVTAAVPAVAESYVPIKDQATFLSLVEGRELSNFFYGVSLSVSSDGQIDGSAIGWDIVGNWTWENGYFCRELSWGGDPIPYNCQLVEARGDDRLRFTVDQGAGDSASFRLK